MFDNRVLRKIFWPKKEKVRGDWRKLNSEEPHDLYPHQILEGNQIKKNEIGVACVMYRGEGLCTQGFGGET